MRFASDFRPILLAVCLFLLGCTNNTPDAASSGPSADGANPDGASAAAGDSPTPIADNVRRIASASLPATQGKSPPLDGGRLQVPLLPNWVVPPRSSDWLFRLQRDRKTAYPQILVTVDDQFQPEVERLVRTNVEAFVPLWQRHLEKSHQPEVFGEPVSPVRIGKRYAVEYLIHSSTGKMSLDQLKVSLVGEGKVYTLELRALRGTLETYRMEFYAVVAGVEIGLPAESPAGLESLPTTLEGSTPADEASDAAPPASE